MQITKLSSSDWPIYKQIWLEAVKTDPTAYFDTYEDIIHTPASTWQEKFHDIHSKYYFAMKSDTPIGLAGFTILTRKKTVHIAEIGRVFVSKNYRRQGIGRELLITVLTEIKSLPQIKKIKIQAVASQIPAIKLYSSLGFETVGQYKKEILTSGVYYDEILMEMML